MAQGNGNPQYYEGYFNRQEALACKEQLEIAIPGLELEVTDNTWGPEASHGHTADEYLHSRVVFLCSKRYVASVRSEEELDRLIAVARILTSVEVFSQEQDDFEPPEPETACIGNADMFMDSKGNLL
jgi:hypothetical protein